METGFVPTFSVMTEKVKKESYSSIEWLTRSTEKSAELPSLILIVMILLFVVMKGDFEPSAEQFTRTE